MKRGQMIECRIEELVLDGSGLACVDGRKVHVYNALPGELVKARIVKARRKKTVAIAEEIIEAAVFRQEEKEDHFLSCSPLQIMKFGQENIWKKEKIQQLCEQELGEKWDFDLITPDESGRFGYRTKMEYSFFEQDNTLSLAFFQRGGKYSKIPIDYCELARNSINEAALAVVAELNKMNLHSRSLKTLILRANTKDEVLAALFVKDEDFPLFAVENSPVASKVKGFKVYYSNPKSPASLPSKLLYSFGKHSLAENLGKFSLEYGLLSFFQIYPEMFVRAVEQIGRYVSGYDVLDYYCGVGAISIALSDQVLSSVLIDNSEESIEFAQQNIANNGLTNFVAYCDLAEKILDYICPEKILILDPPRSGLHPKVTKKIMQELPWRIVYLSCNIKALMEDLKSLLLKYKVVFTEAYNFFPASPHVEFLIILDRK